VDPSVDPRADGLPANGNHWSVYAYFGVVFGIAFVLWVIRERDEIREIPFRVLRHFRR
jgi:hypothetical protein